MLKISSSFKSEKGTAVVIFALSMTVVLGFCALAVDFGVVTHEKNRMSNAVDAAALAGAQELIYDKDNVHNVVNQYLVKNSIDPSNAEVVVFDSDTKVSVTANKDVNYYFARIFGVDKTNVKSVGVAECAPICGVSEGIRPFGIAQQTFEYGKQYTLKEGGGEGYTGNYGALNLNKSGSNEYGNNIVNGYKGYIKVGDLLPTEPGNMCGDTVSGISNLLNQCNHSPECTFDNFNIECPRLITVIIIDSFDVNGRSDVTVMGFAKFFLEEVIEEKHIGVKKATVIGRFVKAIGIGNVSRTQTDYGFKGVKLIQ